MNNLTPKIRNRLVPKATHVAMTLIELLVVVVILTSLVVAVIPAITPTKASRTIRTSAGLVQSFLQGAQIRAAATGRPFGVMLKKLSNETGRISADGSSEENGVCLELFYVESPVPFSGFDEGSVVRILNRPNGLGLLQIQFLKIAPGASRSSHAPPMTVPAGYEIIDAGVPKQLIAKGDLLYVRGEAFRIERFVTIGPGVRSHSNVIVSAVNDSGQQENFAHDGRGFTAAKNLTLPVGQRLPIEWTAPAPYKIVRQPTLTSDPPLQLPVGTAIDLRASGFADDTQYLHLGPAGVAGLGIRDNSDNIIIMFSPSSQLEKIYLNPRMSQTHPVIWQRGTIQGVKLTSPLYLLVGQRRLIPHNFVDYVREQSSLPKDEFTQKVKQCNWLNLDSKWIAINPKSGRVSIDEVAFVNFEETTVFPGPLSSSPAASEIRLRRNREIRESREFARTLSGSGP